MSQYVGQRVTCRVQAGNFDLLLTCLAEPDKGMPVGCSRAGTKIHVVGSFGRLRPSNRLYVRCGKWGGRRSSNCRDARFHRRFGWSVLLLMISARHKLLCATSANSQANRGRKHADPDKGLQAGLLPIRSCHLQTLINLAQPMSQDWPMLQYARVCEPKPFSRKRQKMHETPEDLRVNPSWSPPGLCRPGICQLEFCRQETCQLAQFVQRAADGEGPQQRLFPLRPKMQSQ